MVIKGQKLWAALRIPIKLTTDVGCVVHCRFLQQRSLSQTMNDIDLFVSKYAKY